MGNVIAYGVLHAIPLAAVAYAALIIVLVKREAAQQAVS